MGPTPDRASSFLFPLPPFATASRDNVNMLWPQNLAGQAEFDAPPAKRPRNSDDAPLNPPRNAPLGSMMPLPPYAQTNPPSRGTSSIFFKTRLCQKFKTRSCQWGNNCKFAHGIEELRQPPPDWGDLVAKEWVNGNDQQRMHKTKICRKFYNGEVCPYGVRCSYLHVQRDNSGMAMGSMSVPDSIGGFSSAADCNGSNQKPKAKICYKWETTEVKKSEGHVESDNGKIGADPSKPLTNPTNNVPPIQTETSCTHQAPQKKGAFRKLAKKLNCIYADWIDDAPLSSPHFRTSQSKAEN